MNPRTSILTASLLALTLLSAPAIAQKKVPGETWRQTMSMDMAGMSMPGRTTELCIPTGSSNESLYRSQDKNCTMYDMQTSGNRFTAKMRCTGTNAMEGSLESISEGNRTRGTVRMKSKDGEMSMKYDNTRLGAACEALDYSDYKPPVVAAPVTQSVDPDFACKQMAEQINKDPAALAGNVASYVGKGAACAKSPTFKMFCSAVQSHSGFLALKDQERQMAPVLKDLAPAERDNPFYKPLSSSLPACGLGTGAKAIDGLHAKLLGTAEASGAWKFMIIEGTDETYASLVSIAKSQCSGRSYTNAANAKYLGLCREYGSMLVRGNRQQALESIGIDASGTGSAPAGAGAAAGAGTTNTPGASASPAGAPAQQEAQPSADAAAKERAKEKVKENIEKGKKALRGLFGGG